MSFISVSNDFWSTFVVSINVFDCRLFGVNLQLAKSTGILANSEDPDEIIPPNAMITAGSECVNLAWGMDFNSKLGVYKQEWHYQVCLVFNPNPNVYYWMLILNVELVLNAKPGIQSQTWYLMHGGIHKYYVIFSPNVGIQRQAWDSIPNFVSGIQYNVNSIGIQGNIWDWISIV